jgi:formyl-CoA transferase
MLQSDLGWPGFCRAIGRPELEKSDLYGNVIARWENRESLIKIIDDIIITRTMAEWEKIFRENNLIYGRVDSPEEVINNPQAVANNLFPDLHHPDVDMKVVATPVTFMQDPASVRGPAPELGQHTEEILLGLDYTWEDIADLKDKRIIL